MLGRGRSYIWFLAGLAAIVAGFWPSFYGNPRYNDFWHMVHGIAATFWVVLLIAQSLLIGQGNRRLHERLGWLSVGLFLVLSGTTVYMIWVELVGQKPFTAMLRQKLVFADTTFFILFVVVYALGLVFRRTPKLHARLMGSTILTGLGPSLARFYGNHIPQLHGLSGALPPALWTIDTILVAAILLALRRGQTTRPFPAILAAFVVIELGAAWASGETFARLARAAGAPV